MMFLKIETLLLNIIKNLALKYFFYKLKHVSTIWIIINIHFVDDLKNRNVSSKKPFKNFVSLYFFWKLQHDSSICIIISIHVDDGSKNRYIFSTRNIEMFCFVVIFSKLQRVSTIWIIRSAHFDDDLRNETFRQKKHCCILFCCKLNAFRLIESL